MDSTMLWINEGYMQDDAGNLVITSYVDLREPDSKRRIRTLTKGCRREHALEDSETVLMSPLKRFRKEGAKLIQDAQEGLAKEETETVEPETPEEATERRRAEELNEAVELTGSQIRMRRRVTHRKVHRSKDTFSFGREWWIFSTAITPETDEEWAAWRATLDPAYDHESEIGQPAKFAEALARMVAEQLGPQGKDGWAKSSFGGAQELRSRHGTQWVIHGPVVYVDSVYEALSGEMDEESRIAASMFTKSASHAAMREYRFVILRDGTVDDKVPLRISGMMRDALQPTEHGLVRRAPQETGAKTAQSQPGKRSSRTTKRKSATSKERVAEWVESKWETKGRGGQVLSSESERREHVREKTVTQTVVPQEGDTEPVMPGGPKDLDGATLQKEESDLDEVEEPSAMDDESAVKALAFEHSGAKAGNDGDEGARVVHGGTGRAYKSIEEMVSDPACPMGPTRESWAEAALSVDEVQGIYKMVATLAYKVTLYVVRTFRTERAWIQESNRLI